MTVGLEEKRGRMLEKGEQVKGVSSVPLCAKCFLLRSRRTLNNSSLSVISIAVLWREMRTLSGEPGREPLMLGERSQKASRLISLRRMLQNRFVSVASLLA